LGLVSRQRAGFPRPVRWLENLERKMDWLHFQGLFKVLAFLGGIAYACKWARPDIPLLLAFDRTEILSGEVWRIFTFILAPAAAQAFSPVGALFMVFGILISFMISDSLESVWGSTRTTLYIVTGWFCLAVAQFVFDLPYYFGPLSSGTMLYSSVFFAFATLFPRVELTLFFLIPVEVRVLAWIAGVLILVNGILHPLSLLVVVPGMIPYALWVLPGFVRNQKTLVKAAGRRRQFTVAKGSAAEPFHVCEVCRRTEHDPADLEFFVLPDGKEYCSEHLPTKS
jgi:hypothetical protein